MEALTNLFNLILYQPLFNALVVLYQYLPGGDFGIAVIVLTILIRIVFYPAMLKSIKSQKAMQELQPELKRIQEEYKSDKEKQSKAMMELYQKKGMNPFGGCLPLLIQLPILLALYRVFWKGLQSEQLSFLYSFVSSPGQIDPFFLGVIDLSQPHVLLALGAGILQFFQGKMISPKNQGKAAGQMVQMMQKQMIYFFPIITVLFLWQLPSAIGLYWMTTSVFTIIQQKIAFKNQ